jgi:hypothetical protein
MTQWINDSMNQLLMRSLGGQLPGLHHIVERPTGIRQRVKENFCFRALVRLTKPSRKQPKADVHLGFLQLGCALGSLCFLG